MLCFFSSQQYEYPADPEVVIKDASVMVSFGYNREKVHPRVQELIKHRRRRRRKGKKDESKS